MNLSEIIQQSNYPLADPKFSETCRQRLDHDGALVLPAFLTPTAIEQVVQEGIDKQSLAWYTGEKHNVYLRDSDPDYPDDHPRNKQIESSKGCITDDQISANSPLRTLYDSKLFRDFLCQVLGEAQLYNYADPLSSINLHYASEGQELGWHFDNSSFAITLLIQKPKQGGSFEYVENMRNADRGEMNYDGVADVLAGRTEPKSLTIEPGALVMFRGRNAIHRVTPTEDDRTRMLVVLAYNSQPGIAVSESARMTFYGRL
ncbi:MAG: 2OG-Fe(II) oxygenase [Amphritea sp.]